MARKPQQDVLKEGKEGEAPPHPGIPRIFVTYDPPAESGSRLPNKIWHGISFEPGKATPIEHLQEWQWRSMKRDIDEAANKAGAAWSYAYVVEEPPPPVPVEPPPEPEPEPEEPEANHRRKR